MLTGQLNINSPEILLNSWIDMNVRIWAERGSASEDEMGQFLLAGILMLGQEHDKLLPMFRWLQTSHAAECFCLPDTSDGTGWVMDEVDRIDRDTDCLDDEMMTEVLEEYISLNHEFFKYDLNLGEPVYVRDILIKSTYEELYRKDKGK